MTIVEGPRVVAGRAVPRGARPLRVGAILALALTTAIEFAHLLEAPQKLQYDVATYVHVAQTLYPWFAVAGAPGEILGVLLPAVLAFVLRGRRGFAAAVVATGAGVLAFAVWIAVVAPVNPHVASWTPTRVPADWTAWRDRWELGHVLALVPLAVGLVALGRLRLADAGGAPAVHLDR